MCQICIDEIENMSGRVNKGIPANSTFRLKVSGLCVLLWTMLSKITWRM